MINRKKIPDRGGNREFEVLRKLGSGRFAQVYMVQDEYWKDVFVIKVFNQESGDFERAQQEFKILKELAPQCKYLPQVYDIYQLYDLSYYVKMEYIEGQNLTNLITLGVSLREAYPIVAQLLKAVSCLHENQLLHRDIKPDNILITPQGRVVLVDFNVSRRLEGEHDTFVGTPGYIPPEIIESSGTWQYCGDLYAVGVVLYELLTGHKPFKKNQAILNQKPLRDRNISDRLAQVTLKTIAYEPTERFQSAEEMLQALKEANWGFELPKPPERPDEQKPFPPLPESLKDKIKKLPQVQESDSKSDPPIDPSSQSEQDPLIFTVPKLPTNFVNRPEEETKIIELLLPSNRTSTVITALVGGGGFGKTTLAQAICYDKRVKKAFADGILWVTVGEKPNLIELLTALAKSLNPQATIYSDIILAANQFSNLLANRKVLVVLDDVWSESDIKAFLSHSPTCAYLFTTRRQNLISRQEGKSVNVNEMKNDEAAQLLAKSLPQSPQSTNSEALERLAKYLGEWPLLLKLAASQLREFIEIDDLSVDEAIADLYDELKEEGFTTFDNKDERARNNAISISLEFSLTRLNGFRERFLELSVFEKDVDIPFTIIGRLWKKTANLSSRKTKKAIRRMQRLSLFTRYDGKAETIGLHNVIRSYLTEKKYEEIKNLHTQLLSTYGSISWANLPRKDSYIWYHLTYHLKACDTQQLRNLLVDFSWLQAKLEVTDVDALLADYKHLPEDEDVQRLAKILGKAAYIINEDETQLASQLWGRLADEKTPLIRTLLEQAIDISRSVWLRPLTSSFREHPAVIHNLIGPKSEVNTAVLSADGNFLVCGFKDGTVQIWNFESGKIYRTLTGHTDGVNQVIVTPDDHHIISASYDKTIKIWDLKSGQQKRTFKAHTKEVSGVAITHDGRFLISWSSDKTIKVWSLKPDQVQLIVTHKTKIVNRVAVTHQHGIISASDDKDIQVLDLEAEKVHKTLTGHSDSVNSVITTNDERWVISASNDSTLRVWDLENGETLETLEGHRDRVNYVILSPDGRRAISASADQTLKVWNIDTYQVYCTFEGHSGSIRKVTTTPRGDFIVSASDEELKVWKIDKKQEYLTLTGHTREMTGLIISPNGQYLISTAKERTIKVWDFRKIQAREAHIGHTGEITAVIVDPNGYRAISASKDGTVKVWSFENGKEQRTLKSHTAAIDDIAISSDSRSLLSVSQDRTVRVWNIEEKRVRQLFTVKDVGIVEVELELEEGLFFSIFDDGTVKMSELEGLQKQKHALGVSGLAMSTNRNFFVSASQDTTLKVWDLNSEEVQRTLIGHTAAINAVAMGPDECSIVSASEDQTVKVWDINSGEVKQTLTGHDEGVNAVAVSSDGRFLVSASRDQTLRVWDFESEKAKIILKGHSRDVRGVAISRDGRFIISASRDRTVRVWNARSGKCITTCNLNEPLNTCGISPDGRTIVAGGVSGRVHFLRLEGLPVA